jgi:hypothetical protein
MMLPTPKPAEEIVTTQIGAELVVYDREHHQAHALNPTAAFVFMQLDGQISAAELRARLAAAYELGEEQAEQMMWLSLDRLQKAHLLQGKVVRPADAGPFYTRRQMLKLAGVTVAILPVVASMIAPTPAQAQSPGDGGGNRDCRQDCRESFRACVDECPPNQPDRARCVISTCVPQRRSCVANCRG